MKKIQQLIGLVPCLASQPNTKLRPIALLKLNLALSSSSLFLIGNKHYCSIFEFLA